MLATHAFMPHISSPLAPRSPNIYGRAPFYMSSTSAEIVQKEQQKCAATKWEESGKRVKKAPSPKQDELKERRRGMFLRGVREGREEKRWAARGEDIMRLDFMQRQRQWEAAQAREAPPIPSDHVEEEEEEYEMDLPSSGNAMQISQSTSQQPLPEDELEEVLQREQEELDALLAYLPEDAENNAPQRELWSDDDYDAIFSEVMEGESMNSSQIPAAHTNRNTGDDEMDLS